MWWQFLFVMTIAAASTLPSARAEVLELRNNRLFLPVSINGVRAEALLDSAAEMTVIDPKLAGELGLKTQGSATTQGSGGQASVQFAEGVAIEAALDTQEAQVRSLNSIVRSVLACNPQSVWASSGDGWARCTPMQAVS